MRSFRVAAALAALALAGVACSSSGKVTTSSSGATGSSPSALAAGDHLVVAAPQNQEGFARAVAIAVDVDGVPTIAFVSSPLDDQAKPVIRSVHFEATSAQWQAPVVVGQIEPGEVVVRMTSGIDSALSVTAEIGSSTTTFTSSDDGASWQPGTALAAGSGDPTTATNPKGGSMRVHVVRDGDAPGIYVEVTPGS